MLGFGQKRFRVRISKKTRFISHMFASFAFIALFIWGWDLQVGDAVAYLLICVGFLLVIVATAAVLGWLMRIMRTSKNAQQDFSRSHPQDPEQKDSEQED